MNLFKELEFQSKGVESGAHVDAGHVQGQQSSANLYADQGKMAEGGEAMYLPQTLLQRIRDCGGSGSSEHRELSLSICTHYEPRSGRSTQRGTMIRRASRSFGYLSEPHPSLTPQGQGESGGIWISG